MPQTIEVIYENGSFRPLTPLEGLKEHDHVTIAILGKKPEHPLLKHAGTLSDEDAKEILKIIEDEFEQVDPNDWK